MNFPKPASILPHSGSMVLLDKVVEHDTNGTICLTAWKKQHFLSDSKGCLPPYVLVELSAQTVAVHVGIADKAIKNKNGYLISIKSMELTSTPIEAENELLISITVIWHDEEFGVFDCNIKNQQNITLFKAQMTFYQPS